MTGHASFGLICRITSSGDLALRALLVALPVGWLVFPLARARSAKPSSLTVHDEGLSLASERSSLSVTRDAVRSVRLTPWDLVIVLDGSTISVPRRTLIAGTIDAVAARLHGPTAEPTPQGIAAPPRTRAPYRSPETRAATPEDQDAEPREWLAPAHYRYSVHAFPSAGDHVRALLSLKRRSFFMPAVLGALLVLLGTAGGADRAGELVRFTNVGVVVAIIGIGSIVLDVSPALFALRDRSVRERSAGVLYAVGASGLYVRTRSFEHRESWHEVYVLRSGRRRVAFFTASLVHVVPVAAFATEGARAAFVTMMEREIATHRRRVFT